MIGATRRLVCAALVLAGAVMGACDRPAAKAARSKPGIPMGIVCTTGMITDIVSNIGGERVRVTGLMGEGVDPHLYKASPGDVRLLSDADVIFYNGLHLEGKMADVLIKLAGRKPTFAVTEGIPESLLREPPEFAGQFDPHVWFDVSLWMRAAERVREALAETDPAGRETYTRNADAFLASLGELHTWCGQELARVPRESRLLVTAHDAFGYFGRAYDIEVRAIQGISTDSEPSIKEINSLVDLLVGRKVPAVFVESSVPRKTIDALIEGCAARGHTVRVGGQLFSDAMGKAGTPEGTYIGMVRHNVNTIVHALLGAPAGAEAGAGSAAGKP